MGKHESVVPGAGRPELKALSGLQVDNDDFAAWVRGAHGAAGSLE